MPSARTMRFCSDWRRRTRTRRWSGATFSSEPYGMAISKAHPEFTSFVNGVLAEVRANGTWTQTYNEWLAKYTRTAAPPPPPPSYR